MCIGPYRAFRRNREKVATDGGGLFHKMIIAPDGLSGAPNAGRLVVVKKGGKEGQSQAWLGKRTVVHFGSSHGKAWKLYAS